MFLIKCKGSLIELGFSTLLQMSSRFLGHIHTLKHFKSIFSNTINCEHSSCCYEACNWAFVIMIWLVLWYYTLRHQKRDMVFSNNVPCSGSGVVSVSVLILWPLSHDTISWYQPIQLPVTRFTTCQFCILFMGDTSFVSNYFQSLKFKLINNNSKQIILKLLMCSSWHVNKLLPYFVV